MANQSQDDRSGSEPPPGPIPPSDAIDAARNGFEEHELLRRPVWRRAIEGKIVDHPRLVQRLDYPDRFYYIVSFRQPGAGITAQAIVDALAGSFSEAEAVEELEAPAADFMPPARATDVVMRARLDFPGWRRYARVIREGLGVHPTLVWRYCVESRSPYVPFFLLMFGDHPIYVRSTDGAVFTALHEPRPGS
jgi:hypothetical protein